MTTTNPPIAHRSGVLRSNPVRLLTASLAAVVALSGCGATGGDEGSSNSTTSAPSDDSTTTTTGDTTSTTEADETTTTSEASRGPVSKADLEAILPEAADIGPTYVIEPDDEDSDDESDEASDAAMREACPDAAPFMDSGDDDSENLVKREFSDPDERGFEVEFNLEPENFDEPTFSTLIDAVNACQTIRWSTDDGFSYEVEFSADPDETYGDRGVLLAMELVMNHAQLPQPVEIRFESRSFLVDTVSVKITASDGIDEATYEAIAGDFHLIEGIAADLEPKVADLVG